MIYYCKESWWCVVKKMMFVCSGNICRSVIAEHLFKDILKKKGIESKYEVYSSGVFAYNGQTPPKETIDIKTKENCISTFLMSTNTKILNKILANRIQRMFKKITFW